MQEPWGSKAGKLGYDLGKPCRGGERLSLEELNQYRQWVLEPLKGPAPGF